MKFTILSILLLSLITSHHAHYISVQRLTERANYYRKYPSHLAWYINRYYLGRTGVDCRTGIHGRWRFRFKEKCKAIKEAIYKLNKMRSCHGFWIDEGLTRSAYEHSRYQVSIGRMTHTGPRGRSSLSQRLQLYNRFRGRIAENIIDAVQGYAETEDSILANWAIDDGVPSRGHFKNLFNCTLNSWGVGIQPYTSRGRKMDRVTTFFATTSSCCYKCPFSSSVRRNMSFTDIKSNYLLKRC